MDRPAVRQVPEGSGEQGKMEKTGCKIICGAPTTLAFKGFMMMMMMMITPHRMDFLVHKDVNAGKNINVFYACICKILNITSASLIIA